MLNKILTTIAEKSFFFKKQEFIRPLLAKKNRKKEEEEGKRKRERKRKTRQRRRSRKEKKEEKEKGEKEKEKKTGLGTWSLIHQQHDWVEKKNMSVIPEFCMRFYTTSRGERDVSHFERICISCTHNR